jgi:biotin/methionine sulfoxide reductase
MSPSSDVDHSSHWGVYVARVRNGRLTAAEPSPHDDDPSPLLTSTPDALHAPNRVLRPAVRQGWLDGRTGRRGAEPFVEVDWETALDLVAAELRRVRSTYGDAAVFGGSYGWSSAGRFHHAKSQLQHFLATSGGYTGQISNYSFAAANAVLPHIVGDTDSVLGTVPSWDHIREHGQLVVMLGGAPAKNVQVEPGGVGRHASRTGLLAALDAGVEIVNVNPVRDDAPAHPRAGWLPIRPGTDTALLLALCYEVHILGLTDREFLDRCTVGFDVFARYLGGEADGVAKSAAWAEKITGVPAARITSLAESMASRRTLVTATWSLQRAEHGEQPYWAVIALAAMLGQIGMPGGGFGFGYGSIAGTGSVRRRFGVPAFESARNPVRSAIPVARVADMLLDPGGRYSFDGEERTYPDVRLVYWAGGNPFHHHQDLNRLVEAWQRPETVIVHEPWWTPTAKLADIVLPATWTPERDDIAAGSKDPFITAMKRLVEPAGEARDDHEILRALARRLGTEEAFTGGLSAAEHLQAMYETARASAAGASVDMPPFEDFWAAGTFRFPDAEAVIPFAAFRADPTGHPLRTPSGRIEIHSERVAGFLYDDCPGHPVWLEPREWLGAATDRHPFHLLSPQPASRLHSQLDMGRVSQASKIDGHEPCTVHPADAASLGIREGDVVRISNDRGELLAGVRLSDGMVRGVVLLATGAWFDPADPARPSSLERHGNPNVLSADRGTSQLGQGPSAQSVLVSIERWSGDPVTPAPHALPAFVAREP